MQSIEWLPVQGYEGSYEVSNTGLVRSVARVVPHSRYGVQTIAERILRPSTSKTGHKVVSIRHSGRAQSIAVHILVARAFVPGRAHGLEVCHGDGNPANNDFTNLRWGTKADNARDAVRHGTHTQARKTHCKWGHELVGDNVRRYRRGEMECRSCRACERDRDKRRRAVR